ncbi:Ig-like domain-containing protein [Planctomycetota bacterium]
MKKSGMSIIFVIACIGVVVAAYGIGICVREIRFHRARIGNEVAVKANKASTESIAAIVENDQPTTHSDNPMTLANVPTADNINVKLKEDISISITLMGSDPEGGPLIYRVVETPRHGRLSSVRANIIGANLTYTPDSNYTGPDRFTYKVNNGKMDSDPATVTLSVLAANDPLTVNQ